MGDLLSIVFNVLLHILLLGSMALFAIVLIATAVKTESVIERVKRVLALFLGAIVVVGAQVSGVSYAQFTAGSLANARVASGAAAVVTAIIPALVGGALGYLIVWTYSKSEVMAMRILCFVGMLALVSFIEVYAMATQAKGVLLGAAAVPNIAFVAGVGLVFIFSPDKRGKSSVGTLLKSMARRGQSARPLAPERPGSSSPTRSAPQRDPFDI